VASSYSVSPDYVLGKSPAWLCWAFDAAQSRGGAQITEATPQTLAAMGLGGL